MASSIDPTDPIREKAASLPDVATGTSCNQSSFKVGKVSFLFIGPGAKGVGFKAMFKLDQSMSQARKLASKEPGRFEVGSTGWVTTRFTAEEPLPKSVWQKWLQESYDICCGFSKGNKAANKKSAKVAKKNVTAAKKKSARKTTRSKSLPNFQEDVVDKAKRPSFKKRANSFWQVVNVVKRKLSNEKPLPISTESKKPLTENKMPLTRGKRPLSRLTAVSRS